MAKHSQKIRRQIADNCLSVFDHFVKLTLIGLRLLFVKVIRKVNNSIKRVHVRV